MGSQKRSRSTSMPDEIRAECPFTIIAAKDFKPAQLERRRAKKRKRDRQQEEEEIEEDDDDDEKRPFIQVSPFNPDGKFKTHKTMDMEYYVDPRKEWLAMTRFSSFVLNGNKYYCEGFVYVANEATIERQNTPSLADHTPSPAENTPENTPSLHDNTPSLADTLRPKKRPDDGWVARILEIRASDEHHVYARVYWMYWPDELPPCSVDGRKIVRGRQSYHGQNELIASNHMDIINVITVNMPAVVNQWIESDDETIQDALYWRQAFDIRKSELSSVAIICKCQTPANPDRTLIGCTNSACGKWMHHECLSHDVLMKVWKRLGTKRPHPLGQFHIQHEGTSQSLSPTKTAETQESNGNTRNGQQASPPLTDNSAPPSSASKSSSKTSTKNKPKARVRVYKPYQGFFTATLKTKDGLTAWEIVDLRENVQDGLKSWTESSNCLLCDAQID